MPIRFSFSLSRLFRRRRRAQASASSTRAAARASSGRPSFSFPQPLALAPEPQAASTCISRRNHLFTRSRVAPIILKTPLSPLWTPSLSPLVFSPPGETTPSPIPKIIVESDLAILPLPSPHEPTFHIPPLPFASPSGVRPAIYQAPKPLRYPNLIPLPASARHVVFQTPVLPEMEEFQESPGSTGSAFVIEAGLQVGGETKAVTGTDLAVSLPDGAGYLDSSLPLCTPKPPPASTIYSGRVRTVSLFAAQPVRVNTIRLSLPAPLPALKTTYPRKRKSKHRSLKLLSPLPPLPVMHALGAEGIKSRWSRGMENPETHKVLLPLRGP